MMHVRAVHKAELAYRVAMVLASLVFAGGASWGAMVGSRHDFVDNGFTGGGVCAECHIPHGAKEVRLYPRDVGAAGVDGTVTLLCQDCHKAASPSVPAGAEWTAVAAAVTPPAYPHGTDTRYNTCTTCHSHAGSFGPPPNDDCLTCHKLAGISSLNIDQYFDGIGDANPLILSQHNMYYKTDANTATYEPSWPAAAGGDANECKKCHGDKAEDGAFLKHPSATVRTETLATSPRFGKLRSVFLAYSDATGNAVLPAYGRSDADKTTYEPFCLRCHAGEARASTPSSAKFGGALPAQQVGPTSRADPATQQAAPAPPASGWIVPPVPAKDGQLASPYLNQDPAGTLTNPFYFAYYDSPTLKGNGHGAANSLIQTPAVAMNRTCLSSGGKGSVDGCHVTHGSKSRFLLDDTAIPFAPGIQTATQVGTGVCLNGDCHVPGVNFALPQAAGKTVSTFHGWWNTTPASILHDNSPLGGVGTPPAADGMAQWHTFTGSNMNISASPPLGLVGVLPFYASQAASIQNRIYPTATALTTEWVHCLTCHDPHGTGPDTQPGMLRRYDNTMESATKAVTTPPKAATAGSDLCGQCHVE